MKCIGKRFLQYIQTFCKCPPKMSSLDGCLQKVVVIYESLDQIKSNFCLITIL